MSRGIVRVGEREEQPDLLSTFDKFVSFSFRIFSGPAGYVSESMPKLRSTIERSYLRTTPEGLISVALLVMTVTAVLSVLLIFFGFYLGGVIWYLLAPVAIPIEFVVIISLPRLSATTRAAAVENEMPFVLGYMSVLSGGGVSPMATIRRISEMSLMTASQKEAKRILLETDVFGQDPITAMETVAKETPSRHFSEFLSGYTSILKTGGDFAQYIGTKLRDVIATKASQIKRSSDITGTMAEAYLTITVILGMTLYTLYMVQTILSHSTGGLVSLYLFAFLIIPLISVGFVYMTDAVQPHWPFTDYRPYKHMYYSVPLAIALFLLPLPLHLYQKTALSLAVAVATPAAYAWRYARQRRSLETALPDFLRDVAEGRKTGLSPEKSIERLSGRPYGYLSRYVQKMGSQLSWGVDLSKVISTFTSGVSSWITRAIGALLIEVVDVGGGTVRSFSEMADFSRTVNDLENDKRAALRPFVFITYIAGVMVIFTTFILVYMLAQPATVGFQTTSLDPGTIDTLLTTAVFDAFVIGIVAGKMGEGGVSDGFKHGLALAVIGIIAINVFKLFIPIPV